MFHQALLFLLGFVLVETAKENLLCKTASTEIWYTLSDERNPPSISIHPCEIDPKASVNISVTWIPRMDLQHLTVIFEAWLEAMKIAEYVHEICSGIDNEFEFCGALKGETISLTLERSLAKVPYFKGNLLLTLQVYAGEQRKLAFGTNVTFFKE